MTASRRGEGEERDEMKSWEIRGALRAHMAADMVNLDCVCVVAPPYRERQRSHMLSVLPYCMSPSLCVYSLCVFGFLGLLSLGTGWKTASRLVLSEDWPRVGLGGRVKIEARTHRETGQEV